MIVEHGDVEGTLARFSLPNDEGSKPQCQVVQCTSTCCRAVGMTCEEVVECKWQTPEVVHA